MCTTTVSGSVTTNPKIVQRINYGTIFREESKLILSKEVWLHTFHIWLPTYGTIEDIPRCTRISSYCSMMNHTVNYIHSIHIDTMVHVNHTVRSIHKLIPQTSIPKLNSDRVQRALLPFVGNLFSGLFGMATMHDVNILASHINSLTKVSNTIVNTLHQHASHISSFMKVMDQRTTNLLKGIQTNYQQITRLTLLFNNSFSQFEQTFTNISTLLADQVHKSSSLINTLANLQNAIENLVQGKLSPFLLPETILEHTINQIERKLAQTYNRFHLIYNHPAQYYKEADFMYARHGSSLYVTVRFPISSHRYPLTLYQILSLPIPINSTSNHASQLLDIPDFLALTDRHDQYALISQKQLTKCSQSLSSLTCNFNIPLKPVTLPNCITALFFNNVAQVKSLCNFRFVPNLLESNIIELSPTSVLIYNVKNIDVDCPNSQRVSQGCTFCIFELPCQCSISTESMVFTPRLINCEKESKNVSILYPVNLALLQEFFNNSKLVSIFGDTTFRKPIQSMVPNLKIYNHSFSRILADDRSFHLSLKKLANAAKKDQIAFKSLAEPLLDGQIFLDSDYFDTKSILLYATLTGTVISIIASVIMMLKLRKLATALIVLQRVASVKSFESTDLPSFIYENLDKQIETDTDIKNSFFSEFGWIQASVALAIIVLIILIIIIVLLLFLLKRQKETILFLEITSGGDCVTIPIIYLPLCPSYWNISQVDIEDVTLASFPSCTMFVKWNNFQITNKLNSKSINVKDFFSISFFQYLALRKIIQQPFCAYILIGHQRMFTPLNFYVQTNQN